MSVAIRLSKTGKKNAPSFRIVVQPKRSKRDGMSLDVLGHYNPSHNPVLFDYDKKKMEEWVKKGAEVSDAVKNLMLGKYSFTKYDPKKAKEAAEAAKANEERAK